MSGFSDAIQGRSMLGARVYESLHPRKMFAEYVPD
jgi:hypothetical protein